MATAKTITPIPAPVTVHLELTAVEAKVLETFLGAGRIRDKEHLEARGYSGDLNIAADVIFDIWNALDDLVLSK